MLMLVKKNNKKNNIKKKKKKKMLLLQQRHNHLHATRLLPLLSHHRQHHRHQILSTDLNLISVIPVFSLDEDDDEYLLSFNFEIDLATEQSAGFCFLE